MNTLACMHLLHTFIRYIYTFRREFTEHYKTSCAFIMMHMIGQNSPSLVINTNLASLSTLKVLGHGLMAQLANIQTFLCSPATSQPSFWQQ